MENVTWPALVIKAKSRTGAVDLNTQMTQMCCYFSPQENNSACLISEAGCTLTPVSEGCEKDATDAEMEGNAHDMSYESSLKDYSDPTHSEIKVNGDDMKPCLESANKAPISSATQTEKSRKHRFSGEKEQGCDNVEQKEEDNDDVASNTPDAFTFERINLPETETRETPLLMKPEEHGSNEEEKERDSAIKCELTEMEGNVHDMSYESNLKDYSDPTHSEIKVNDDDMKPCLESANKAPISSATQTEKSRKHRFSGEKEQGCDNVEQKEEDNDDVASNTPDAFTFERINLPETETRETALLMTPEERESNEEEKERDSAIKCELAAVSVKTFKDWLVDPNLYKVSLPDIKGIKLFQIEVKTHNCSQAAVDGEQIYYKKMRSHVPISLFYISTSPIHSEGDSTCTEIWSLF